MSLQLETRLHSDTPKLSGSNLRSKNLLLSEMRKKMLQLDPRSPAFDFDRTPILKPKSLVNAKARSQENLITSAYDIKMPTSRLSFCETATYLDVPEVNALPDIVPSLSDSQAPSSSSGSSRSSSIETISDNSAVTVLENEDEESLDNSFNSSSFDSDSDLKSPKVEDKVEDWQAKLVADSENIIDNVLITAMKDFEIKFNETENKIKIWRDTLSPVTQVDSDNDVGIESEAPMEFKSSKEEVIIEFDDGDCNLQGTIKKQEINVKESVSEEMKKKIVKKELESKKLFSPTKKQITETKNLDILTVRFMTIYLILIFVKTS